MAGKAGIAALRKAPAKVLIKINQQVGFRLITKFGEKGVINLWKLVPIAASGIGAVVNLTGMQAIAGYAKHNFPQLTLESESSPLASPGPINDQEPNDQIPL